jgi:arabinogalactan endo-1,4-beta-galactosidase
MRLHHRLGAVTAGAATAATIATLFTGVGPAHADDGPVEAGITVHKIEGLAEDFINGVDVSSVLSLEESGVVFRNADGTPGDLFEILADHGVTDVRIRVWNDPYDSEGNGYGGGTVDAARAVEIGDRATDAGLHVTVDFHYADFWAHPGQQPEPKAWADFTVAEKADATHDFTHSTLAAMATAGVDVTMVQVGNETNGGMVAGESGWANFVEITNGGAAAVREVFPDALVAVHFTNPESQDYWTIANNLQTNGMDYDVFASSYYPYWHGTLENLTNKLYWVAQDFGKKVMVAETSYAYTLEDGDGHENTVRSGSNDDGPYPTSVQGQATAVRDVMEAVANVGEAGLGVYYWEPAWLPVGPPEELEANKLLWERDGSGWASSYAGEYSTDAGTYYGGSSWDNQALFGFDGTPLESLNVFEYARTGSVAPLAVTEVEKPTVTVTQGDTITLPSTVTLTYNDSSTSEAAATWDDVLQWITSPGTYTVNGVAEGGYETQATVVVRAVNYLTNGNFETGGADGWNFAASPWPSTFWVFASEGNNAIDTYAVNTYNATAYSFAFSQAVSGLEPGSYTFTGRAHGQNVTPQFFATTTGGTTTVTPTLTGWTAWKSPTITFEVPENGAATVGVNGTGTAGAWAWFDNFELAKTPTPADTSELEALVDQMEGLTRSVYSAESLAVLDDALEIAGIVLAASDPTEQQVADAIALAQSAFDALVVVGEVPDPTVDPVAITVTDGDPVTLPSVVTLTLFDGRKQTEAVEWSGAQSYIDGPGEYTIRGTTESGLAAIATVTVTVREYLVNGDLETGDLTGWSTSATTWPSTFWYSQDASSVHGTTAVNIYGASAFDFTLAQVVSDLPAGTYVLSAQAHGGSDAGTPAFDMALAATTAAGTTSTPVSVSGWGNWATFSVEFTMPESGTATVTLGGTGGAGDWAFFDDFSLVENSPAADFTALNALVDQANGLDRALYEPESLAGLEAAEAAYAVLEQAASPSQATVDEVAELFTSGLAGLDLIDVEFTTAPTPTISGTGRVGHKLTATAGTWVPTPSGIAYQWNRNGNPVSGATAPTYLLKAADAGASITVTVTASKADYITTSKTSAVKEVEKLFVAPKPRVGGTPVVGATLTAVVGSWSPKPDSLKYQWYRNGKAISGQKSKTYVVKASDLGDKITVTVTGAKSGYTTKTVTASSVTIVKRFTSTGYASISGTAEVGKTLTAHRGVWSPTPSAYMFQWLRNGVAISGATSSTYKLTSADKGKKVAVKVTALKAGYLPTSDTSSARTVK